MFQKVIPGKVRRSFCVGSLPLMIHMLDLANNTRRKVHAVDSVYLGHTLQAVRCRIMGSYEGWISFL